MCLIDNKRFRFTFKRIPVYKVFYKRADGKLYTPFRCTVVRKRMYGGRIEQPFKDALGEYFFGKGFIHACLNNDAAQHLINSSCFDDEERQQSLEIIEGYIPAFTRYALDVALDEICARRMVFPNV